MNSLSLCEGKTAQTHPGCLGTLSGPCADYNNPTRNNNFYSRKLWENVFKDPLVVESLEDRVLIGELDHPGDRLETKAKNACIVMTGYEFDDVNKTVNGTFDILDTPNGQILKSLLDYGCKIGVFDLALLTNSLLNSIQAFALPDNSYPLSNFQFNELS